MFAQPRAKKALPVPPPKKRKANSAVEEINFDFDARQDYLTGFHKRKLQRQKWAQDQAAKKEREEKIELRKQARQERQREVEDHVQAINKMLSEAQAANSDDDQEIKAEDFEEWNGIEDEEAEAENGGTSNIVDYEDEYVDEDKYTSVKVEAVSVSKDGFEKVYDSDHEETGEEDVEKKTPKEDEASTAAAAKKVWPKKQKKKFRYEHKLERQAEGRKQKARKRAKIK